MISAFKIITRTKSGVLSLYVIGGFILMALFADLIANDRPIIAKSADGITMPIFSGADSKSYEWSMQPIIRYKSSSIGSKVSPYQSPAISDKKNKNYHLLGTDHIGRDVAAGIVSGSRWALLIGVLSILFALLIGISLGTLSGYYGDKGIRVSWIMLAAWIFMLVIMLFYIRYSGLNTSTAFLVGAIGCILSYWAMCIKASEMLSSSGYLKRTLISLPMDLIVQRLHELWKAVPVLFILLSILALVTNPDVWTLIFTIGILSWPPISRLVRAELLKVREMNYIKAAKIGGLSQLHIICKHALPNAIAPLFVLVSFGISGAIVVEATLSFLGIGISPDNVTWGSLMGSARTNYRAWWLAVFPGICIFLLVLSFNTIGERLREHYEKY